MEEGNVQHDGDAAAGDVHHDGDAVVIIMAGDSAILMDGDSVAGDPAISMEMAPDTLGDSGRKQKRVTLLSHFDARDAFVGPILA